MTTLSRSQQAVGQGDSVRPSRWRCLCGGCRRRAGLASRARADRCTRCRRARRSVGARRPRVVVLATGTELRRPGEPLGPGEVYEANGVLLATALASAGADVETLPTVADDAAAHRRALERGSRRMSSSRPAACRSARTISFAGCWPSSASRRSSGAWRSSRASPLPSACAGRRSSSAFPATRSRRSSAPRCSSGRHCLPSRAQGSPVPCTRRGSLASAIRRNKQRDEFVRARSVPSATGVVLEPITGQESHMIARAATADVLVHAPRGDGELAAGDTVRYLPLA